MAISDQHPAVPAAQYDAAWLRQHLTQERRAASLLSEIREAVFGAQDGLTSVLAVVSTVGGATGQSFPVLVAGLGAPVAATLHPGPGANTSRKNHTANFSGPNTTPA